jgi:hypothetical protein
MHMLNDHKHHVGLRYVKKVVVLGADPETRRRLPTPAISISSSRNADALRRPLRNLFPTPITPTPATPPPPRWKANHVKSSQGKVANRADPSGQDTGQ